MEPCFRACLRMRRPSIPLHVPCDRTEFFRAEVHLAKQKLRSMRSRTTCREIKFQCEFPVCITFIGLKTTKNNHKYKCNTGETQPLMSG